MYILTYQKFSINLFYLNVIIGSLKRIYSFLIFFNNELLLKNKICKLPLAVYFKT